MRRLALLLAGLALALAACGGTTGTSDEGALPTADELGDCPPDATDCGPDVLDDPAAEGGDGGEMAGMCAAGEPDCVDTVDPAAGTCLAGTPDCADDPSNGQDMARQMPVGAEPPSGEPLPDGTSDMAQGAVLSQVGLVDDTTLRVQLDAGACDVLQDVVVQESDTEVRLLVLVGPEQGVEACTEQVVSYVLDVALDAPLADRAVLDLGG